MILPSIAQHAKSHDILPLKKYGQNFIFDSSLCEKIVRASEVPPEAVVFEIGPGVGGLTRAILAHNPKSLIVIEIDKRCLTLLSEIKEFYPNLKIIESDALKCSLAELQSNSSPDKKINIISNLPYNIGTELVIKWLKEAEIIGSITIMLQKEVVERICAQVGTKAYGRLSVICQLICKVEKCFDVSAKAFYPAPKVQSSIVKLIPKKDLLDLAIINKIELITRFAFSERRKMIKSSLKKLSPKIEELLYELKIDNSYRAENLSPLDYLALAKKL